MLDYHSTAPTNGIYVQEPSGVKILGENSGAYVDQDIAFMSAGRDGTISIMLPNNDDKVMTLAEMFLAAVFEKSNEDPEWVEEVIEEVFGGEGP